MLLCLLKITSNCTQFSSVNTALVSTETLGIHSGTGILGLWEEHKYHVYTGVTQVSIYLSLKILSEQAKGYFIINVSLMQLQTKSKILFKTYEMLTCLQKSIDCLIIWSNFTPFVFIFVWMWLQQWLCFHLKKSKRVRTFCNFFKIKCDCIVLTKSTFF